MSQNGIVIYQNSPQLVREVNALWRSVYETLARQVAEACLQPPARILEIGCFSGGVGLALLKRFPAAALTVALDMPELKTTFHRDWEIPDASRLTIVDTAINRLALADESFDLVFCRGGFFFLDDDGAFIRDIYRIVAPGGVAFFGGGYGAHTPERVIAAIADTSRTKNDELGRRIFAKTELQLLLEKVQLANQSHIIESGGLWIRIRKPDPVTPG